MAKVASFTSDMLELVQAAAKAKEPIVLEFASLKQARYFATRMNRLRAAMRNENHWLLSSIEQQSFSVDAERFTVTVRPADYVFSDTIRNALKGLSYETDPLPSAPGRSLSDKIAEVPLPLPGGLAGGGAEIPREKTQEEISKSEDALAKFLGKGKRK